MKTTYPIRPRLAIAGVLGLTALFTGACQPEMPPSPTPLPTNQPAQTAYVPTDWTFAVDHKTDDTTATPYEHRLVKDATNEVGYLLSVKAGDSVNATTACYWKAAVPDWVIDRLKPGSTLRLKAAVQLDNIQGEGACLALAGDAETARTDSGKRADIASLLATTQYVTPLKGTAAVAEYAVELHYPAYRPALTLYLMLLPGTTGTVIFRHISLEVAENETPAFRN